MDEIRLQMLKEIADLHGIPEGAYNIRENGKSIGRTSTDEIEIISRQDGKGLEIYVKPGTKKKSLHIPVIISQSGLSEVVYNDFHIGADCDVTIIAGCGIHNPGEDSSRHDGIHSFYVGENSRESLPNPHQS